MPAPRPRHARATPAPHKPNNGLQPAPRPRHARATPASLSCDPREGGSQTTNMRCQNQLAQASTSARATNRIKRQQQRNLHNYAVRWPG
eukprot:gene9321-biopygen13757